MELEIKKIETLYCPKCGGELSLGEDQVIGICLHCESAFLLTDEEISIIKRQELDHTALRHDSAGIVSKLCASNKAWIVASDDFYVSPSMKNSLIHKKKMGKVKKSFGIPEEDDVFIIADTGTKSYSLGFALCTSGFYYAENSHETKGKLSWKEFKKAKIVAAGRNLLLVNDLYFEIFFSAKDVARILKMIQHNL